jgi:hypothetical protein
VTWSDILKLLHVAVAIGFIAGLIGRAILLRRAARANDVAAAEAFSEAAGPFERLVILGSALVLPSGLITAWAQGYPWLGLTTGWMLAAVVLYAIMMVLVPTVFLPRGRRFEAAMARARAQGTVTPELRAAFADPAVAAARTYEVVGVAIIVSLMVLKPF